MKITRITSNILVSNVSLTLGSLVHVANHEELYYSHAVRIQHTSSAYITDNIVTLSAVVLLRFHTKKLTEQKKAALNY